MSLKEEFDAWRRALPLEITADPMWHCTAYRLALFVADRAWNDIGRLAADARSQNIAGQLSRALGSISNNYIEAYSRSAPADRCRFYEYCLASTRESRDWIFKGRRVIGEQRTREHLEILTRVTQLVTVTIVRERGKDKRPRRKAKSDDT